MASPFYLNKTSVLWINESFNNNQLFSLFIIVWFLDIDT